MSTIRGRADLEYNRKVVAAASQGIIITDPVITLAKDFTNENFLKGGHETCGNLSKKVRYSTTSQDDLDLEDKEFLMKEDVYMRRNLTMLNPLEDN